MGETLKMLLHDRGTDVAATWDFLLWTIDLLGRIMSLPGVFGAVMYGLLGKSGISGGLLRGGLTVLNSKSAVPLPGVAGALPELQ